MENQNNKIDKNDFAESVAKVMLAILFISLIVGFGYLLKITIPLVKGQQPYINMLILCSVSIGFFIGSFIYSFLAYKNGK